MWRKNFKESSKFERLLKGTEREGERKIERERKEEIFFNLKIFEGFITNYYQFQKKLREGYELWKFSRYSKKIEWKLQGF